MLLRMYLRWAEDRGYGPRSSIDEGDEELKNVTVTISGPNARLPSFGTGRPSVGAPVTV
jgi:protein subunit release factor B